MKDYMLERGIIRNVIENEQEFVFNWSNYS